jgi:hypothetical protein
VRRRTRQDEKRLTSWTGSGHIDVRPNARERGSALDVAFVVGLCLAVDLIALAATVVLTQRDHRIACGGLCFDNPSAHIHDDLVTLWAFGVATVGAAALVLIFRRLRIPVLLVQGLVAVFVAVHTVPDLHAAQHRKDVLEHCRYGLAPPCPGIRNLGPP